LSYQTLKKGLFSWSWKQYGHGKLLLLAFHGFNRSPDDFEPFGRWLGEKYTILAFDLFFHGKSYAELDEPFPALTLPDLKTLLDEILKRYNVTEFEVLAYSFGGRLALNCVEIYGNRVKGLYLMAPDGLRFNPGFFFAVQTRLGRLIFKKYTHDAGPVIKIMKLLPALRLYDPKVMDFYMNHLLVESMRMKVYHTWMFHRNTVPNLNRIARIIKSENIRLLLIFGKFDMIIPEKSGNRIAKKTGRFHSVHILDTGHRLNEKHQEISKIILTES
jgi:pimeloyl-ACP methyl ester carboxylesterase